MPSDRFLDMLRLALPVDVNLRELQTLAPQKLWLENPREATKLALRKFPRINWGAYCELNDDVREAGLDPCDHFIQTGIYEGKKLVSWNKLKEAEKPNSPLVSIVIINYNNAHLLCKCLDSVISQTLRDIEIIIVDDSSTDESRAIIHAYAAADNRIKVILNAKNSATLITRKRGVQTATGRYLMFLDSDDYMVPEACEIAAKAMSLGYDMVKYGAYVFNSMNVNAKTIGEAEEWCNRGENREYYGDEILTGMFSDRSQNWIIWANIYVRELVVAAFNELPDEYFTGPDDLLAVMAIARNARHMLKIPDKLYFYNYGPGVSLTNDKTKLIKYLPAKCNTIRYIREYALKYELNVSIENLYLDLCDVTIEKFLPIVQEKDVPAYFWHITDTIGFKYILKLLIERHGRDDAQLAALIRPLPSANRPLIHLGIYYPVIGKGGVEVIIQTTCNLLKEDNCKITIFTEERSEQDLEFPAEVDIIQIQPAFKGDANLLERMLGFEKAISESGIDILLHAGTWRSHILWDVMVLHQHAIPVIFLYHFNFALSLVRNCALELNFQDTVFRKADAVTCLSTIEELYLRNRGVNAIYLPNPIKQVPYEVRREIPAKIAFVGRLGSHLKQVNQALLILREVISRAPWISMYLVGDFQDETQREEYQKKVAEYGLERNITLTGWTDNPNYFLRQCGILLSTAYWEAFPMGIAEAQAIGLPCVIYELNIEQARNNPSIIQVRQGDHLAAASEILSLFADPEKWQTLSRIAVENCKKYSAERYADNLRWLLANFRKQMPIREYTRQDYKDMTRNISFYSKYKPEGLWE
ncbi:MAG: glycosyltransferase [Desulfovibrio sp.]|nr:glycosyltransferase [Desulfovibrio sp.]